MKLFEIKAPDGRLLRQEHDTIETLKAQLVAGYEVTGVVFGAASDGTGGLVEKIGGPSLMAMLLEAHGDELLAYLTAIDAFRETLRDRLKAKARVA